MEENHMNLPENTAFTEQTPTMEESASEQSQRQQNASMDTRPAWKKALNALWDIVIVCAVIYGIRYYYTSQVREIVDDAIYKSAVSALSELREMDISYSLEFANEDLPKAQKYSWKELNDGGGRVALAFQIMKYSDDFSEVIKTGKAVKYLKFTRPANVRVKEKDGTVKTIGSVEVTFTAFYQGHAQKGILCRTEAELDSRLKSYINSFVEAQKQKIFEQSFELKDSSVDFYNEKITIYYSWTNLQNEELSPMWAFDLNAYQGGHELNQDYYRSETDLVSGLVPGYTGEYSVTYYLHDIETPVRLVVSNTYDYFFEDDKPSMEFEIPLSGERNNAQGNASNQHYQGYSDFYTLYQQFQQDCESGNYFDNSQDARYSGEEVRDYRNYDGGEKLAELTLHDFGGYGEVGFYELGQDELHYDVTLEGLYTFDDYTVDYFQYTDFEGIRDLLIFRSGNQEWLVTWNTIYEDGIVYTYEA